MAITNHQQSNVPKKHHVFRHPIRYSKERYRTMYDKTHQYTRKRAEYIIKHGEEYDRQANEKINNLGISLTIFIFVFALFLGLFKLLAWI